jgi:hypothetical protein
MTSGEMFREERGVNGADQHLENPEIMSTSGRFANPAQIESTLNSSPQQP